MHRSILFFLLLAIGITPINGYGQITFEAKLTKTKLGLNERLRVSFQMNQNGDNFLPPSFDGFNVVGGPNQSVSNSWVNGVRSFSKTYTYFLTPTRKGELTIGQASIVIDGETYKTSPKKVSVTEAVKSPNSPQARANSIAEDNLHLVAEISKSSPYLNEAITVIYKLYYTTDIGISNVSEVETPKYADFWSHVIPIPKLEIKRGTYKGRDYNYVTWRKTVLYPQKSGKLSIAPLTLNVSVDVPTNRRDLFGNRVYQKAPQVITAGRRVLNVKALPETGRPVSFKGAVGNFDLNVRYNKTALKSSESFQATVKVSGRGNLKLFQLPNLNVPSTLERYEPEHKENIKTNLLGMQGSIEDIYTIVPQFQGNYPIPSVEFSYFDPVKEQYIRLNSNEQLIDVFEGPVAGSSPSQTRPRAQQLSNDPYFNFIKLDTQLFPMKVDPFYRSKTFWIGLLSAPLLLFITLFFLRHRENSLVDDVALRQRHANKLARKYLSSAKKVLGEKGQFYEALERALHNYLKSKLNIETADFSKTRIADLLHKKNINEYSVQGFIDLLETCELARYSPSGLESMETDYDKAKEIITTLDKEI